MAYPETNRKIHEWISQLPREDGKGVHGTRSFEIVPEEDWEIAPIVYQ